MSLVEVEKIWDDFIQKCAVDSFGEQAVITEGKRQRNFLGSVEAYKKIFMAVAREHLAPLPESRACSKCGHQGLDVLPPAYGDKTYRFLCHKCDAA
jgi:hypothetical protein